VIADSQTCLASTDDHCSERLITHVEGILWPTTSNTARRQLSIR
jgi:hypothetical protein